MTLSLIEVRERSSASALPVELYTFVRGQRSWHFTSADRTIVTPSAQYLCLPIERTAIEAGSELARSHLKLTVPRDMPIAEAFRVDAPSDVILCHLVRTHWNLEGSGIEQGAGSTASLWSGRLVAVSWSEDALKATLTLAPIHASLSRPGLRRVWSRQCPHVLYGPNCRADRNAVRMSAVVTAVLQRTVHIAQLTPAAHAPARLTAGGIIEYITAQGIQESNTIQATAGDVLQLSRQPLALTPGMSVSLWPGCNRTWSDCDQQHTNTANFGGIPFLPETNPFASNPF